jgi:methionyl-tRNA formyltransferase
MGTLNVHPSLLPAYRGSAPIQYAIWNRDAITGVSIIDLSPVAFDSGKVLNQVKVKLTGDEYFDDLHDRLAGIGGNLLAETLDNLNSYQLKAWTQDETRVTKAPKIKVEQGQINWIRDEVDEIFARYRAFGQKIPLYSFIKGKRVKFLSIQDPKSTVPALHHEKNANFGRIAYLESTKLLYVKCKDGWIPVRELVVDGKKPTCAKDFRNGHLMDGKSNSFEYIQG